MTDPGLHASRAERNTPRYVVMGHDAALIAVSKTGGHVRSTRLLRARPKQAIVPNAAAPGAFVRQMESTSRDPFATLEACGRGRTGCNRHRLAWNALRESAGPLELLAGLSFRQLPRGSPCRQSEGRWRCGLLLSFGAAK